VIFDSLISDKRAWVLLYFRISAVCKLPKMLHRLTRSEFKLSKSRAWLNYESKQPQKILWFESGC